MAAENVGFVKRRASVLDCASPLALFHRRWLTPKRQRAAAVQNLPEFSSELSELRPQFYLNSSSPFLILFFPSMGLDGAGDFRPGGIIRIDDLEFGKVLECFENALHFILPGLKLVGGQLLD